MGRAVGREVFIVEGSRVSGYVFVGSACENTDVFVGRRDDRDPGTTQLF
jgi:hypothetical protein